MADIQARVEDYLDDQIQTAADLDGINGLLARVEEQQSLLQKQVCLLAAELQDSLLTLV